MTTYGDDASYHTARAKAELAAELIATSPIAASSHNALAERYTLMASDANTEHIRRSEQLAAMD